MRLDASPHAAGLHPAAARLCSQRFQDANEGEVMSRSMLCGLAAGIVLSAPASARANDAEDEAAALVVKLGGTVWRDAKRPGKPVVEVSLHGQSTSRALTGADLRA